MRKRILIVEDISDLRTILRTEVQSLGYETFLAGNGKEAVAMASDELPDLIMMDVMMPEMDGLEAATLIRNNPKTSSIPILGVTVLNRHKDIKKFFESGFSDYINKPFTPSQLDARIKKLLEPSEA
ncbi:MAG TPA: response regulator [Candidatus Binatia bacterium]